MKIAPDRRAVFLYLAAHDIISSSGGYPLVIPATAQHNTAQHCTAHIPHPVQYHPTVCIRPEAWRQFLRDHSDQGQRPNVCHARTPQTSARRGRSTVSLRCLDLGADLAVHRTYRSSTPLGLGAKCPGALGTWEVWESHQQRCLEACP